MQKMKGQLQAETEKSKEAEKSKEEATQIAKRFRDEKIQLERQVAS